MSHTLFDLKNHRSFKYPSSFVGLNSASTVNILNTFLFLFAKKMLGHRAGFHKMLVRIANREDSDQIASSSGSALFISAFLADN